MGDSKRKPPNIREGYVVMPILVPVETKDIATIAYWYGYFVREYVQTKNEKCKDAFYQLADTIIQVDDDGIPPESIIEEIMQMCPNAREKIEQLNELYRRQELI